MHTEKVAVFYPDKSKGNWGMKMVDSQGYTISYHETKLSIAHNDLRDIQEYLQNIGKNPKTVHYCRDMRDNNYLLGSIYAHLFDNDYIENKRFIVCYPDRSTWYIMQGFFGKDGSKYYKGFYRNTELNVYSSDYYSVTDFVKGSEPDLQFIPIYVSKSMNGEIYLAEDFPQLFNIR